MRLSPGDWVLYAPGNDKTAQRSAGEVTEAGRGLVMVRPAGTNEVIALRVAEVELICRADDRKVRGC